MTIHGTPPWHLWGNVQTVNLQVVGSANPVQNTSSQLARIKYKRPDSWRFFMKATLLNVTGAVLSGVNITVAYQVSFGTGRAVTTLDQFVFFEFDPVVGPPIFPLPQTKWASSAIEPARVGATSAVERRMDVIPADSIQCNAICSLQAGDATAYTATLEVTAFFAPLQHVRPEWFEKVGTFNGQEDKGAK